MEKSLEDLTIFNEIQRIGNKTCEVCYLEVQNSEIFTLPCLHSVCTGCLKQYLESLVFSNTFYPITCPFQVCGSDIFRVYKPILSESEYFRIKSIRKIRKKLKNPEIH
jgi:Zinc finger, C3HC4 type (RING finger).